MDDILDMMRGFDKKNEIINLWYDINFLRLCVNKILEFNPELKISFNEEILKETREEARKIVRTRFPHMKIGFDNEETDIIQEDPSCNPPVP